ncbi:MAG: flagellin hook IN motif-containing protein [Pseudomonadota bacterium]|nr:flagellin hook IN motif-containing protein [Pseudomonadota bacterium]
MIRTTKNHFYMSVDSNLSRLAEERNRYLQQISTGKNFSRVSEAPVSATAVLTYKSEDVKISQLGRNMVQGDNQLAVAGTVTDQAHSVIFDAKGALTAWPSTQDSAMQQTMIQEIRQFEDRLYGLANTINNGGSLFAGYQRRESEAYSNISTANSHLGAVYNGDGGAISMEVGILQTLQLNVVGGGSTIDGREIEGVFRKDKSEDSDARDIFALFSRMIAGMEDGSNALTRTSSEFPPPVVRNLAVGELEFLHPDGTSTAVGAAHVGGADTFDYIANNAWNINDAMAPGVTARLRAEVSGGGLPNFAVGDDRTMAAGDLKINGVDIGAVDFAVVPLETSDAAGNAALTNIRELAAAINRESDQTGVWATYEPESDGTTPYDYNLVLTSTEADGQAITIELANDAHTQTGLGTAAGITDYHPGGMEAGPPQEVDTYNAVVPIGGHSTVYASNNGALTLVSDDGFELVENSPDVLSGTLGLSVNEGLNSHKSESILDQQVSQLDEYLTHFTAERASIAARRNHIEASQESLDVRSQNLKDAIDSLESVNMEEAIMKYYAAQNHYEATLASSSRIMTTSILDYLR